MKYSILTHLEHAEIAEIYFQKNILLRELCSFRYCFFDKCLTLFSLSGFRLEKLFKAKIMFMKVILSWEQKSKYDEN